MCSSQNQGLGAEQKEGEGGELPADLLDFMAQ